MSPDLREDRQLLAAVAARDHAAFGAFFRRYYPRVHTFVKARLDDAGLCEETVADTFVEVWRGAPDFRGASRVSTWIFGIATFKCMEALRHRRRLKRASVLPTPMETLQELPDERDAGQVLEARDELRWFRELLVQLPAAQREVLELALLEGHDTREIAQQLGISAGTVKSRLFRARTELRAEMRRSNRGER